MRVSYKEKEKAFLICVLFPLLLWASLAIESGCLWAGRTWPVHSQPVVRVSLSLPLPQQYRLHGDGFLEFPFLGAGSLSMLTLCEFSHRQHLTPVERYLPQEAFLSFSLAEGILPSTASCLLSYTRLSSSFLTGYLEGWNSLGIRQWKGSQSQSPPVECKDKMYLPALQKSFLKVEVRPRAASP